MDKDFVVIATECGSGIPIRIIHVPLKGDNDTFRYAEEKAVELINYFCEIDIDNPEVRSKFIENSYISDDNFTVSIFPLDY